MYLGAARLFMGIFLLLLVESLVVAQGPPFAEFLTEDDAWCQMSNNQRTAEILITGEVDTSRFELQMEIKGRMETLVNLPSGVFTLFLNNQLGQNEYIIHRVIEYQEDDQLETVINDTLQMVVHPYPDMSFSVDEGDRCSPADVILRGREGYPSYTWDFGDGTEKQTSTNWSLHSYEAESVDQPSTYLTKLKVETEFGCIDSVSGSVEIFPSPEAEFTALPQLLQYPHVTVTLSNLTEGDWNYLWDFGDDSGSSIRDPGTHEYTSYGIYKILLEVYSAECSDTISQQIQILPPPPLADFSPDTAGCPPFQVSFENLSVYAESYSWDFDDGGTSTEVNPTHSFLESGEYHVKLVATGISGSHQIEKIIMVHELPQADFSYTEPDVAYTAHSFYNSSLNAVEFRWDFGDGSGSEDENPTHTYLYAGNYTVTLYVTSAEGCLDTLVRESLIEVAAGEGATQFPNVFMWNGTGPTGGAWSPGSEDRGVFHPKMNGATEFRMIIYNRLGHKIFETNEVYVGWDGYLPTGVLADPGVYVYKAWITYPGGLQEVKAGDVTFLYPPE